MRIALLAFWMFLSSSQLAAQEPIVCFTPGGNCTALIVEQIDSAVRSIDVQAYGLSSTQILKALSTAKSRGIVVRIILDKSQKTDRSSGLSFVINAGIPVWIDSQVAIAHNKVLIIDGETVITGSFNFTRSAQEKNAENVLVLKNRDIAERYEANWQARQRVSILEPKGD